jgi:hypothetical protein
MTRKLKWLVVAVAPFFMASSGGGCSGASDPGVSTNTSAEHQDSSTKKDCKLGNGAGSLKHIVYIIFDNTHLSRDNANVPSDLEQMPHLKDFLTSNGALLSNHHTPLIAHTANDILTAFTGVYPDRHGVPVANSFRYFNPDGTSNPGVSFAYWTDPIYDYSTNTPTDTTFNMLNQVGQNASAPWVPFTRAGCNVGAVASANIVLENIATDIPVVFGPDSGQAAEVVSNAAEATADFVGIAIHCAKKDKLCSAANGGLPDVLPDEPNGYNGYKALFGHKYVAPQLSSQALTDLDGNVISDGMGNDGFPGFDGMFATVSLSYVASMLENGVQVVYAYISDAHDDHTTGNAFGPGEAGYVAQLKAYDSAFDKFFTRLSADGIDQTNTLFVFTADEGDHFAGGPPTPADCDGITTACTYATIGEVDTNLTGYLNGLDAGVTTAFKLHSDSAPVVYITGNPADSAQSTRDFDRAVATLQVTNSITGNTENLTNYLADQTELALLHMITADTARDPTLVVFAKPDYYVYAGGASCTMASPCSSLDTFAWNHGDVAPEINTTWLGMVGPGVKSIGLDDDIWSDHTDERPTLMTLAGLTDDYRHQGRVLLGVLENAAKPTKLKDREDLAESLGEAYKQLNAPVGQLSLDSLVISTAALASGSDSSDTTYSALENQIADWTAQRDTIALKIESLLERSSFEGKTLDRADSLEAIGQAQSLISEVHGAAELWTLTH